MKPFFLLLFLLFVIPLYSQLNIPTHFAYVKEGVFKEFSEDNIQGNEYKIDAFYMYRFEVSGLDYSPFLKDTNKEIPRDLDLKRPIVNITYSEAQAYCNWLASIYKIQFRLPSKEEWQYAARAYHFDNDDFIYNKPLPNEHVLYSKNAKYNKPNCTSCLKPNELGLYGMVGNVWEWTEQRFKGFDAFIVGGSFLEDEEFVKVTSQKEINSNTKQKDLGFRMIVDAEQMNKYLLAQKVAAILQQLFPEYTNLGVDAKAFHINDGFINWETAKNIIIVNEKEKFIQFDGINYQKKSDNQFTVSEKFYFDKKDIEKVKELEKLLTFERKSIFN
jgi:hypothetical protein